MDIAGGDNEFYKNPAVVCVFWGLVLFLLLVVLFKVRTKSKDEQFEANNIIAPGVYSAGATMRVESQRNSVPYLESSDIRYLDQMQALERAELEKKAYDEAQQALADQAALQGNGSQVGGDAVGGTVAAKEMMGGSRGDATVNGQTARAWIPSRAPIEGLTTGREATQMWLIGDDISELKHEVSGQASDLSPNRWTLQLQNQVSDINTDSIEGKLNEDVLFQRHLANM
jgi:hypothetical protein